METADTEVFHVVVVIIEEFVNNLQGLFNEEGGRVNVADCFDCLLKNAFAEVSSC